MRLRSLKNKEEIICGCSYLINDYENMKGKWQKFFNNDNPIHVEIGMGKGDFIQGMAKKYPNINFIGIEKYTKVIGRAIKKYPEKLNNLAVINMDAKDLEKAFSKEISHIYLNFSDPWPKDRHAKRRLTSTVFLQIYDNIFKDKKRITLKTDNLILFASSLVNLNNYGYKFLNVNMDLKNSDIPNILTEYEKKFQNLGVNINYLDAEK